MGFNSAGMAAVAANLERIRPCVDIPIGVNIGKNRATPIAAATDDYCACLGALHDVADYMVVNLSSPNTPGLRSLQAPTAARSLLEELDAERNRLGPRRQRPTEAALGKGRPRPWNAGLGSNCERRLGSGRERPGGREHHRQPSRFAAFTPRHRVRRTVRQTALRPRLGRCRTLALLHRRRASADRGRRHRQRERRPVDVQRRRRFGAGLYGG